MRHAILMTPRDRSLLHQAPIALAHTSLRRLAYRAMFAVARRMRAKGPDPNRRPQEPLAGMPNIATQGEDSIAKKQVYFLTFPHPHVERSQEGVALVAPGTLSREDILRRVQKACKEPVYIHRSCGEAPSSVVRESKADGFLWSGM